MGHELLQVLFTNEEDRKLLGDHLVDLRVDDLELNGFRISFVRRLQNLIARSPNYPQEFTPNPFLEKKFLWKEFRYNEDGTEVVTSSGVQWKPGQVRPIF